MDHVAIMKKEWNLTQKIADGSKTVESHWYKFKATPWNKIKTNDLIYFKDSGSPVSIKAVVTGVEQYEIGNKQQALNVMNKYALADLGTNTLSKSIKNYVANKRYAIFIHFARVERVTPFYINKKGFGMQCAWIAVNSVKSIRMDES